jgi:hypothetical protein
MDRPAENVKLDFCPRCRRLIDWALDNVPLDKIFVQAARNQNTPSTEHVIVPLCDICAAFVESTLHVDGFTIYTP